jgi:predicted RNA methylase
MNMDEALRNFWQYATQRRGYSTMTQVAQSWIQDRISHNQEITPELLFAMYSNQNLDWFGEHSTPQMLVSFIGQLAKRHTAQSVLDPTCGLGLLLHAVSSATGAQTIHGIDINSTTTQIAQAVVGPQATIYTGDALDPHAGLLPKYDMIVANPPFGVIPKMDVQNRKQMAARELGHQLALWACSQLNPSGVAVIILTKSFITQEKTINAIHVAGCRIRALFNIPGGTFANTSIGAYITVIEHGPQEQVFVGQVSNDSDHQQRLINNYRRKKSGDQLALGRMIDLTTFRGFEHLDNNERIKRLARSLHWTPLRAFDVIESVSLLQKEQLKESPNCLYISVNKNRATLTIDHNDTRTVVNKYYYLQINQNHADARFLVYWFNHSPIGQATLASIQYEFPYWRSRKDAISLNNVSMYLPPIQTQQQTLKALEVLTRIRAEADELESELWSSSDPIHNIVHKVETINQEDRYEDWLESLPFPLASILWRHHANRNSRSNQENAKTLLHFFEATAAFIATVHLSAFMSDDKLWKDNTQILQTKLDEAQLSMYMASFGAWKLIVEYLASKSRDLSPEVRTRIYGTSNHNHIDMICNPDLLTVLQQANALRNKGDGHGGVMSNQFAASYHDDLCNLVTTLRGVFGRSWRNYELIQPLSSIYQEGIHQYTVNLLIGSRSTPFESVQRDSSSPLEYERLYLFDASGQRGLLLQPFIQVMPAPQHQVNACFFLNRHTNSDKRLVSYHFEQESSITIQSPHLLDAALERFYQKDSQ